MWVSHPVVGVFVWVQRLEADTGMRVIETSAWAGTSVDDAFQDIAEHVGRLRCVNGQSQLAPPSIDYSSIQ